MATARSENSREEQEKCPCGDTDCDYCRYHHDGLPGCNCIGCRTGKGGDEEDDDGE